MTQERQEMPSFFGSIEVSADSSSSDAPATSSDQLMVALLQQIAAGQQRQTKLLEELAEQLHSTQRQKQVELGQWRQANPHLARSCKQAADALSDVQTRFLEGLTEEIQDNSDSYVDSDYMLGEFIDRYGPRLAHLNGVLQMLSQLSHAPAPAESHK
jgi:Mg2+ and Co2+ transporter CorA